MAKWPGVGILSAIACYNIDVWSLGFYTAPVVTDPFRSYDGRKSVDATSSRYRRVYCGCHCNHGSFLDGASEGTPPRPEYLLTPIPYFLVGIGLLRRRPFQWTLALAIGGWIPVAFGSLALGFWVCRPHPWTEFALCALVVFLFASHTALAWMAITALVKFEYSHYKFTAFSLLAGLALFVLVFCLLSSCH